MKITIVQGAFLPVPPLLGGAVEKAWFALGKEFVRSGHEVVHISRRHPKLPSEEIIEGVRHLRISGFKQPRSLLFLKLKDLFFSLRVAANLPPADILVTNTFWLPALVRGKRKGRIYVHVARYPKGQMKFYKHAAALQTVSSPIAAAIRAEAPECENLVTVVPYPVDRRAAALPRFSERQKTIVYAGRVHPEKGLEVLVQGFAKIAAAFPEWSVRIIGPWLPEQGGAGTDYKEQLIALAAKSGLESRVHFDGPVFDSSDLARRYSQAGVFVYPSIAERGETFGLAPLEAMAHGCPTIVSALECFQDFITDDTTGLIFDHRCADAPSALAEKLAQLCRDTSRREQLGKLAWEASAAYTPSLVAQLYLKDFERLCQNRI